MTSSLALQRRLPLPPLDRRVARAAAQICHNVLMQQLYISRADARKQWLVVSNPSEQAIDLTGYSITDAAGRHEFRFPDRYMLLAGDEVTIWCAPSEIDLDVDNLLQPYLFWTRASGALRSTPFFSPGAATEALLLDPLKVEVASLRVAADGQRKEFRVLHCVSRHPRAISARIDTRFCAGCLSPPEFRRRAARPSPDSGKVRDSGRGRDVYVFSRYWGVVSDKPLLEHSLSVLLVPLLESFRALLIYALLRSASQLPQQPGRSSEARRLQTTAVVLLMLASDVMARRLCLCIKSGLLVSIASFTSVVLDQLGMVATYAALSRAYSGLSPSFDSLLRFELTASLLNMAAAHSQFLERRAQWHPLFKQLSRLEYRCSTLLGLCGAARQLLLLLLLLAPPLAASSSASRPVALVLVPLATVAMGVDAVRAVTVVLHLFDRAVRSESPPSAAPPPPPPPLSSPSPSPSPLSSRGFRTPKRLIEPETPMTRGGAAYKRGDT